MRHSLNSIIGTKTRRLAMAIQYHAQKLRQHTECPLDDIDLETVVKQMETTAALVRQELTEIRDLETGRMVRR